MVAVRRKKGYDSSLVGLILGLAFIISMVIIGPVIYRYLTSQTDIDKCRASVSVKSVAISIGSAGTRFVDPAQLNFDCHTATLVLKKDAYDVFKTTSVDKQVMKYDSTQQSYDDKLKKVFADSMRDCWDMFGKGEIDPFTRLDGNEHCVICSQIKFDQSAKDELQKQEKAALTDFNRFLVENYANSRQTYSSFLYSVEPSDVSNPSSKAAELIKDSKPIDFSEHAVFYYSTRGTGAADAAASVAKIVGCSPTSATTSILKKIPGVGKVISVTAFLSSTCIGGKMLGFAIESLADGTIHYVGVAQAPLEEVQKRCSQLY